MILPVRQAMRFFRLFDLITTYAHRQLYVVSDAEFFSGEPPRGIGEQAQLQTIEELWEHPQLLNDYVQQNPDRLGTQDLRIIESWQSCYTATFSVHQLPDGSPNDLVFVSQGYAFCVCGMAKELRSMLTEVPTVVHATLLPFEDRIVYAMSLAQTPVAFGEAMLGQMQAEVEQIVANNRIARTGEEFMRMASKAQKTSRRDRA